MNDFKVTSKHDVCDTALKWLMDKAVIGSNGKRSITLESNMDMLYSMAVTELLIWCISIRPSLSEFVKAQVVNRAIDRWLRYKKYRDNPDKVSAYEEALSVELRKISEGKDYQILGFINLRPEDYLLRKPIEISGSVLEFVSWSELNSINLENVWREAQENLPKNIANVFSDASRMVSTFIPFFVTVKS